MSGEALKGHLDMLLLSILGQGPAHGYALIESLSERSDGRFALPEGTVYPALHRLELDGLLASRWTQQDGRRRRIYSLTGKGRRRLQVRRQEWQSFSGAVGAVLEPGA